MKGIEFEKEAASRLMELGWNVEHTPASNDYGADLICTIGSEKLIVQCKIYSAKPISIGAIQETFGAKAHYGGTVAALVYRGRVTKNAIKLAKSSNVYVLSIDQLEVGCVIDRITERENIIEGQKRKQERDLQRQIHIQEKINLINQFKDEFISQYIATNIETWKHDWNVNHENDNQIIDKFHKKENMRTNVFIWSASLSVVSFIVLIIFGYDDRDFLDNYGKMLLSLSLIGALLGGYHWLNQRPKPRRRVPSSFDQYRTYMLNQNNREIYKKAQVWAEKIYNERVPNHKINESIIRYCP